MYPLNYIPPLKKLNLKPLVSDPTLQIGQHKCPLLSTWPRNNAPKVVGGGEVEIPGGNFVVSNVVGGIIIPSTKSIFFLILFHFLIFVCRSNLISQRKLDNIFRNLFSRKKYLPTSP